jgi:lysophospholipase L1-like esterase
MVSDAVEFPVEPLDHVAVSLHLPSAPERQTGHPGSRATSYVLSGNHVTRRSMDDAIQVQHWYQLAGLDVLAHESARAVVVLGDSITDGFGVLPDTDRRWTDFLIARVHQEPELECTLAILNAGLGGNRLLLDELGPNGMARFERDVIARPGVQHVIVVLGANDLGVLSRDETADQRDHDRLVEEMVAAYEQMAARAREHGIQAIGGTIMPFRGSTFYPAHDRAEASRQKVNAWIRSPGNFDAVIDFDALMRASDDPSRMNPGLDSGDHLHPSIAGYEAMANFVALDLFSDADRGSAIPRCPPAVRTSSSP